VTDELLDAFDDSLRPLGPRPRDEVHRAGLWHPVFHCLVVRTTPPARVLLQRRPATARSFAGLLDLTATGHLLAGERPTDGIRELTEEVGLVTAPDDLVALGTRLMSDDAGEGRNREIVHTFLLPDDTPLEAFELAGCDVDGVIEIEVAALEAVLAGAASHALEVGHDGVVHQVVVVPDDLVPPVDDSWQAVASAAGRFVARTPPHR
jgi:8-oxo-dGTP pyrophosphatase MutT (NUDIX family)